MATEIRTSHPRKWAILALVLAAECMDLLDGTIVNVAAPTIRTDLHSSTSALQWVIGGYALAFAVGLITGGRLGDIYGRKRMFVLGAIGFVIASMACAFASSPEMLIVCRLAQGGAAALLIPQGFGIIRDAFAPSEQATAFAIFGPVIGLSAVLGPIVGGALVDANLLGSSWRLIFFVNVPLGVIAAIGAARLIPDVRATNAPRLDLVGTALAALGMALLVYPLIQGREAGWPAWTYLMAGASAVSFAALAGWTKWLRRRGGDPLVEASIFSHRSYTAGLSMIVVFFAGMIGTMLVLTLFMQFGMHFSAIHAGLTLAPFAAGTAIGATLGGALLVPRIGRVTLQIATVIGAAGVWWLRQVILAHGLDTTSFAIVAPELVVGIGVGMIVSPLFNFVLASVRDHEVGSASGVLNAMQQLAGALGVAGLGTIFFSTLGHDGFVTAISHCLLVELATMPVLLLLSFALPVQPREDEALATDRGADQRRAMPGERVGAIEML
ncbi:MAG TPA: MFS transporter [Solirubrobacteraceae bacterium]